VTLSLDGDTTGSPISYYVPATGSMWPGSTERLDLDTAVSPVRRARFCATRAWRASCWWHREVRCRCRSSA